MLERSLGRPREFDNDAVLDAAMQLFWSNGFRKTTTRDLERALGLSQSSIYNAFGSKQGREDAALDHYEAHLTEGLLAPLENSKDGLRSIDAFFAALGEWLRSGSRGCLLVNMMAEDGAASLEILERTRGYRARVGAALSGALARAVHLGEVDGSGGRAHLLTAVVFGLNIAARGASPAELDAMTAGTRDEISRWR